MKLPLLLTLAQLPEPEDAFFVQWIWSAAAVVIIAYYVISTFVMFRKQPPDHERYEPRGQVKALREELRERIDTVESEFDEFRTANAQDLQAVRDKIEQSSKEASREGSIRASNIYARIESVETKLSDKLEATPEKVIYLLSNMNLLKKPEDS